MKIFLILTSTLFSFAASATILDCSFKGEGQVNPVYIEYEFSTLLRPQEYKSTDGRYRLLIESNERIVDIRLFDMKKETTAMFIGDKTVSIHAGDYRKDHMGDELVTLSGFCRITQ